ncbi:MAG: 2-dehydropantoate 2-reductase N-terminal domain-containing protein, partial [Chloroflexota bacterium]
MRFTIIGAGAIGGIVGAHLIQAGHDVTLVDTVEEHVAAIRRGGLAIEGQSQLVSRPRAAITPAELAAPLGTVICAVKTLHTRSALAPVAPLLAADEFVLGMQNGLAYYDIVAAVGGERTLVACFNFGGHYKGPGRVVHGTRGGFHVGELDGTISARARSLRDALSAVQECDVSDNVLGCVWTKMAMASVFFATALVDADVKDILARERYHDLMADLVAEAVAATDALGVQLIELHGFAPDALRRERRSHAAVSAMLGAIAGSFNPLQQRTGIWIDLAVRKRRTEAEPQLGRLIEEAARVGV